MAIPSILKGNDVILQSETGSGKTLAYSLPILASVDASRGIYSITNSLKIVLIYLLIASIQAVIILPSRELGLQVSSVLRQLASGAPKKIYIMPLVDGSQNRRQQLWLTADPPHIVVGTPKSIKKLVDMGRLRLNAVSYIVMDEIDACLADHESRRILHQLLSQQLSSTYQTVKDSDASITDEILLSNLAKKQRDAMTVDPKYRINRQTIICSATIQQRQHFMSMCHQQGWTETIPELIHVSNACLVPKNIKHEYVICQATHKLACLKYLIKKEIAVDAAMQGIIFVDDTSQLDKVLQSVTKLLADHYGTKEILARGLSEDMNIDDRAVILSEFKENKYKLLVCTDIISRGIDIPRYSLTHSPTHLLAHLLTYSPTHSVCRMCSSLHYLVPVTRTSTALVALVAMAATGKLSPS
jgi:superfamily II DNA/RNA helicase